MSYHSIMLIDDDEDDQEIFLAALNQISTTVKCNIFPMAYEALEKLTSKEINPPQLIFLDLNVPVMSGQKFLFEIKKMEDLKSIPVIVFSTSAHAVTIKVTKDLGAHEYITKPNGLDELVDILKVILN